EPKLVGQSGTDNPASLLVTSAPATMRTRVAQAVKTAKRCSPRWYGISRPFRIAPREVERYQHRPGRFPKRISLTEEGLSATGGLSAFMNLVPIKTPSVRVTTAGQTIEFLDPLLGVVADN